MIVCSSLVIENHKWGSFVITEIKQFSFCKAISKYDGEALASSVLLCSLWRPHII